MRGNKIHRNFVVQQNYEVANCLTILIIIYTF